MDLFDTNIFLEILLAQEKSTLCKNLLTSRIGSISITDFSLHSIGVILFRYDKENIFNSFISDILPRIEIATLQSKSYATLAMFKRDYNLDFDDAYQSAVAEECKMKIVTMDKDFKRVGDRISIEFV